MYQVQLKNFEGPLDLLLFFIRRDELDIYDIPIARITDEYLSYLKVIEEIDLDGAGEFIYIAALLISIKVRMLLPRQERDEDDEPIDPRKELVDRLLEYIRYKEASGQLQVLEAHRAGQFTRAARPEVVPQEDAEAYITYELSVFQLISALQRVLTHQAQQTATYEIHAIAYSIDTQRDYLLRALTPDAPQSFTTLVQDQPKGFIIATFLAILEMVREQLLRVLVGATDLDEFYISLKPTG